MNNADLTYIAINGYGRIGRSVLRAYYEAQQREDNPYQSIRISAINELADNLTIAHLTKYDSTHGKFTQPLSLQDNKLCINDDEIHILHHETISELPWQSLGIDIVLDCTGAFTERNVAEQHLYAGAQKVLLSQPAQSDVDKTIIYGINEHTLSSADRIVSNASCTTNCIVHVIAALDQAFGVDSGVITTIHSAMNDQPVIDAYHHTDLRKTRSAVQSIIPVETGLAKGIERILPTLSGRFQAQAMRVPTVNVSAIDLSLVVESNVSTESVNQVLSIAAERKPSILGFTEEPLASCDFNHDPRSGIIDASQTRVAGKRLIKVLTWFDNEWGFANRMLDVVNSMACN